MTLDQRQRIVSALHHPKNVHLEVNDFRVRLREQHVEPSAVAHACELEVVVVVGEAEPVLPGHSSQRIELLSHA